MKLYLKVFVFSTTIFLFSCGRNKQIWFTELQQTHLANSDNTIRIYLDREGYFYPDKLVFIPQKDFFDPYQNGKVKKDDINKASLRYYFTGNRIRENNLPVYDNRINDLAKKYDLKIENSKLQAFYKIQEKIIGRLGDSINKKTLKLSSKTLVILIHGFNDPNPTGDYNRTKNYIKKKYNSNFEYLEVYWDGLSANNGDPKLERIWAKAQSNTQDVAAGLRMLLAHLDKNIKLRIITHSSGGIVATSLLFNTKSKWKKPESFIRYWEIIHSKPAPEQKDIRLAMLAPALPGVNTFIDFSERHWTTPLTEENNNINKIIVGYNCNDYAVSKRFYNTDYLSSKFGATTLGSNYDNEVFKTKKIIADKFDTDYADQIFKSIAFNKYECKENEEEHGWYYYMQNEKQFNFFIENLFE